MQHSYQLPASRRFILCIYSKNVPKSMRGELKEEEEEEQEDEEEESGEDKLKNKKYN